MESKIKQLEKWIKEELCRWTTYERLVDDVSGEGSDVERKWSFKIYTDRYVYRFIAIDRYGKDGYLGCQVSSRKKRAGESWTRGNDLPDGPFTRETWERIKNDMIGWEIVPTAFYPNPETLSSEPAQTVEEGIGC